MKTQTKIAIAALIAALGDTFKAIAAELNGSTPPEPQGAPSEPVSAEAPAKATRKPREKAPEHAAPAETPAEPAQPETPAAPAAPAAATNGTLPTDEQYQGWRKLIEPLVAGEGSTAELRAAVKAVVAKYSPTGGLKTMDPKHGPAFEKDIDALSY